MCIRDSRRRWASSSRYWRAARESPRPCSASRAVIVLMRYSALFLIFLVTALNADEIRDARKRWAESPHGPLLERILPPTFEAAQLPEPDSRGARLTVGYCVQCHNLPNPAMHDAARWPGVVRRMVPRMEGKGNLGKLMADMMASVRSPSEEEAVSYTHLTLP